MAVTWKKDNNKCLFIALFLLGLSRATQTRGDPTCKEFSLPEDAAKAKAFVNELTYQSRPGKPVTVSTTWRTAAAGDSETAEGVRTAVVLLKQLQGKMEQLEEQLQTGLDRKMEEMETGLKRKMEEIETGLKGKMEDMETGLKGKMAEMETGLKGKMEQLEKKLQSGLDRTVEAILEVNNTTEKNDTDLQECLVEVSSNLMTTPDPQRCSEAGNGMTFTPWGCFKRFQISKTWGASKVHCASQGLELASLERGPSTKEELLQLAKDIGLTWEYWLDLTRQQPSEEWRWGCNGSLVDDGSPLWGAHSPENILGDDKGLLNARDGLRDYREGGTVYFLCALP